jgi:adenosine deaminase
MYIWEEQWENLLSWLIDNQSIDNISYVENFIAKNYAEQLVGLYYNAIEDYLAKNISRDHYKTACKYIRRMIKMGGRNEADCLIADLRKLYPQRRALMEELDKV